jgi:HD-like signal output (HDOD) protein
MTQLAIPTFEQQLDDVSELISLPEIYLKISRLMNDPTTNVDDFAEVIQFDPNLSATVLKVVNSAFYGFSGQIDNIARAINMIGIGQLHIIALSVSAFSALNVLNYPDDIIPLKTFWRSSLFTGVLARQLALQLEIKQPERLFVVGLLHEIGHLVLYTKFPDLARLAIRNAQQNQQPIHQSELQLLGYHYASIGSELMARWNLPTIFQTLARLQPTPSEATSDKIETAILHIAHGYAHKQFVTSDKELEELIEDDAWAQAKLSTEDVDKLFDEVSRMSAHMETIILR